jgi:hypothetical protein
VTIVSMKLTSVRLGHEGCNVMYELKDLSDKGEHDIVILVI